jgi:hypothetical protein
MPRRLHGIFCRIGDADPISDPLCEILSRILSEILPQLAAWMASFAVSESPVVGSGYGEGSVASMGVLPVGGVIVPSIGGVIVPPMGGGVITLSVAQPVGGGVMVPELPALELFVVEGLTERLRLARTLLHTPQ